MNASQLLLVLLQTGAVLLAACLVAAFAKRSPALRVAVGRVALLTVFGLIFISPWIKERPTPVVAVNWTPATTFAPAPIRHEVKASNAVEPAHQTAVSPAPVAATIDPAILPLLAWGAGSASLFAYLLLGVFAIGRIKRSSRPVANVGYLQSLSQAARAAGIKTPDLRQSEQVQIPFVAGVVHPTIYIPTAWNASIDDETVSAILQHEVAHVANGDLRWNLFHRLACAILWPQPLVWMLGRPMAMAGEELCDAQVLASGVPGPRYADSLLKIRSNLTVHRYPSLAIGAVCGKSALSKRIEAILDSRRSRSVKVSRPVALMTRIGALAVAAVAISVFARPTAVPMQDASRPEITGAYDGQVDLTDENGKPVSGARAWVVVSYLEPIQYRELKVSGSHVDLTTEGIADAVTGTLIVRVPHHAVGFVTLWPAKRPVTQLQLPRSTTVKGHLKLEDGTPAVGQTVSPTLMVYVDQEKGFGHVLVPRELPLGITSNTDAKGAFSLTDIPLGTAVAIDVKDPRYATLSTVDQLKADGSSKDETVVLHPASALSGVVMRDGKGVPNIRVGAQGSQNGPQSNYSHWGSGLTDSTGHYQINRLPAGIYNVALEIPTALEAEVTAVAQESLVLNPGKTLDGVNFNLIPGALIEGTLVDDHNKPLPNQMVGIYGPAHPNSSAWVQTVLTDRTGFFRVRVPAGKQLIYPMAQDTGGSVSPTVADGSTTTVHLKATPTSSVAIALPSESQEDTENIVVEKTNHDADPTPPVVTFPGSNGSPFYGPQRLRTGATVELGYVTSDTTSPREIWRPDGSGAASQDVAASLDMSSGGDPSGVRSIFAKLNIGGAPRRSYDVIVQTPHSSSWSVWQTYGDQEDRTADLASFRAPKTLKVVDFRVGVASGPYTSLASGMLNEAPLYAHRPVSRDGRAREIVAGETFSLTFRMPREAEGRDIRLVAYDQYGKEFDLSSYDTEDSVSRVGNIHTRSFAFNAASGQALTRVELKVRDYEWVTFRGVHLYPNR